MNLVISKVLKNLRRSSKKTLVVLYAFSLTACSHLVIRDQLWCVNYPDGSAHCDSTLSNKSYDLNKDAWDKMRVGMVTTHIKTLKDIKVLIKQACSELRCIIDKQNNRLIISLDK